MWKYTSNLYINTIKILTTNRSTKWLKAESKTTTFYRIYKPYTLSFLSFKRSLKRRNVLWFSDSTNVRKVRCYGIKRDSKYGLRNFSYQNDLHVSYQTNFVLISWYVRGTCSYTLPYPTPSPSSSLIRLYWVHIWAILKQLYLSRRVWMDCFGNKYTNILSNK